MRLAVLLCCCLPAAALAEPARHWLEDPCTLLESSALSRLYPDTADTAALSREARSGRFESECLLVDKTRQRSVRLVLHPAKDAERVQRQLVRLGQGAAGETLTLADRSAVLNAAGDSLSWAEANWMLTLSGSEVFDRAAALALAERISRRLPQ